LDPRSYPDEFQFGPRPHTLLKTHFNIILLVHITWHTVDRSLMRECSSLIILILTFIRKI
jgi:hypothetical protein